MKFDFRWAVILLATALSGCAMFGDHDKDAASVNIYEQVTEAQPEKMTRQVAVPKTGLTIPVSSFASLTDKDLAKAELVSTPGGEAILLRFDPTGIMTLTELTTRCRGRYLVMFLNGRPVAAWLCDRILDKGQLLIEGDFTDEEAKKAVESLNKQAKKREDR